MLVRVALGASVEQVEVPESELFVFPTGIVGFEECTRFALFQMAEPFLLLQSVEEPQLGFVLLDPKLLVPEYRVKLSDEDLALIGIGREDQPRLMAVVTISADGIPTSANLRAPLAFNPASRLGVQMVIPECPYAVRFPLEFSPDGVLVVAGRGTDEENGGPRDRDPGTGSVPCSS